MKKNLTFTALLFCAISAFSQTKEHKFGISAGGSIQHYNGNLGNSFFKFKTTCFGGVTSTFGVYLNRSFDFNVLASIGHFGYCQTDKDKQRVVSLDQKCPGCADELGMGDLRSLMGSGNIAVRYKFANGYLLKEDSRLSPYVYTGIGINHLSDVMKKNCVNIGIHYSINGGVGLKYNITNRINLAYNMGFACFMTRKVYLTNSDRPDYNMQDPIDKEFAKRKDFCLQNSLVLGINF